MTLGMGPIAIFRRHCNHHSVRTKQLKTIVPFLSLNADGGADARRESVADPGFPRRGGDLPMNWEENLLFGKNFAENCLKIK